MSYRTFCRLGLGEEAPSRSTLQANISRVREETLRAVNRALVGLYRDLVNVVEETLAEAEEAIVRLGEWDEALQAARIGAPSLRVRPVMPLFFLPQS